MVEIHRFVVEGYNVLVAAKLLLEKLQLLEKAYIEFCKGE